MPGLGEALALTAILGRGEALALLMTVGLGEALGLVDPFGRERVVPLDFTEVVLAEAGVVERSRSAGVMDLPLGCGTCNLA